MRLGLQDRKVWKRVSESKDFVIIKKRCFKYCDWIDLVSLLQKAKNQGFKADLSMFDYEHIIIFERTYQNEQ